LKPILIFKGKGLRFNQLTNFNNYIFFKNENAWMAKSLYTDYLRQVIKPFVLRQRMKEESKDQKALLIMDNFSGHNLDPKEKEEFEKLGKKIKHLKPYTKAYCQPLDLNVNYLINKKMKDFWMEWFIVNKESTPKKLGILFQLLRSLNPF